MRLAKITVVLDVVQTLELHLVEFERLVERAIRCCSACEQCRNIRERFEKPWIRVRVSRRSGRLVVTMIEMRMQRG